jgi:hypothetical protein
VLAVVAFDVRYADLVTVSVILEIGNKGGLQTFARPQTFRSNFQKAVIRPPIEENLLAMAAKSRFCHILHPTRTDATSINLTLPRLQGRPFPN